MRQIRPSSDEQLTMLSFREIIILISQTTFYHTGGSIVLSCDSDYDYVSKIYLWLKVMDLKVELRRNLYGKDSKEETLFVAIKNEGSRIGSLPNHFLGGGGKSSKPILEPVVPIGTIATGTHPFLNVEIQRWNLTRLVT